MLPNSWNGWKNNGVKLSLKKKNGAEQLNHIFDMFDMFADFSNVSEIIFDSKTPPGLHRKKHGGPAVESRCGKRFCA